MLVEVTHAEPWFDETAHCNQLYDDEMPRCVNNGQIAGKSKVKKVSLQERDHKDNKSSYH